VEPDAEWVVYSPYVDLIAGFLDSTQMRVGPASTVAYGYVEFKIEIFKDTGARVDPATFPAGAISFKLPANDDVWNTITTVDPPLVNPDLLVPDPEAPAYQTFIFRLQIDNRAPTAVIYEPWLVPSGEKTGGCGMMHYHLASPVPTDPPADTSVTITYRATHPRGFGMYRFWLYRGAALLRTEEGQTLTSGDLTFDPLASTLTNLLGPCPEAAFSENLYIWNMNFNGWWRVGPDASAVRAFALVKA
jgi:hypothetical protein